MEYKYNLTEEQNIAIDNIFPCWTMERDEDGNIVIYPNIQDEEDYCDDCGEVVIPPNFKVYSELPYNVASANKGESALVCLECDEEKKC